MTIQYDCQLPPSALALVGLSVTSSYSDKNSNHGDTATYNCIRAHIPSGTRTASLLDPAPILLDSRRGNRQAPAATKVIVFQFICPPPGRLDIHLLLFFDFYVAAR
jgi:hypothetical protein